jgi:hypothetical protein
MWAGFPTRTRRCRSFEEATLFKGEECVHIVRDECFCKNSDYLLKHILGFIWCNL